MHFANKTSKSKEDIANMFADFFASVYSPDTNNPHVNNIPSHVCDIFSTCVIETDDVLKALKNLDVTKGPGPDSIPPSVIKQCSDVLALPLTLLFNKSLSSGIFPDVFKMGHVVPIHKKGSNSDIRNYRPITILPILAKVFEKILLSKISFGISKILTSRQHGFMSSKNTTTNLVMFQTFITEAFAQKRQVDSIELDFSKAFDRVSHSVLISKLEASGFSGALLQWFNSYLRSRRLQVRYGTTLSKDFSATSGVPQGSHLGPMLFNLYINDVVTRLRCNHLLFADDMKLFMRVSSDYDAALLQDDINFVVGWCDENGMSLNLEKCSCITFHRITNPIMFDYSIGEAQLARTTVVKDLGVTFSPSLNWELHVNTICSKALQMLGFLFRVSKTFTNLHTMRTLYCCLVRPHLEYASVVWSPHQLYLKDDIERVQRRFVRLAGVRLGFRYMDVPIQEVASILNLTTLESRRVHQDLIFLFKLVNGVLDCPELLQRVNFRVPSSTRSRDLFVHQSVSTSYATNSTMTRIQRLGNSLPDHVDLFSSALSAFKTALRQHIQHI